jgi:cytochrome c-type biogenesis protein CcmH/NrfF
VSIAYYALIALLAAVPAFPIVETPVPEHAVYLVATTMLASAAAAADPADIAAAASTFRRLAIAILFPIAWLVLQLAPLPFVSGTNSIWGSAAIALNEPSLASRISIDPGATLRGLMWYLAMVAVAISTFLTTRDRRRAETILLALTAVTTLIAIENVLSRIGFFPTLIEATTRNKALTMVTAVAALGHTAIVIKALETHVKRSDRARAMDSTVVFQLAGSITGVVICLLSIAALDQPAWLGVAGLGLMIMMLVVMARRLEFRYWPTAILASFVASLAFAATMALAGRQFKLITLAGSSPPDSLAVAGRALADTPLLGSGVGTFEQLARIYQDYGDNGMIDPPSTAVSIVLEWGPLAFLILAMFAGQVFLFLFRGALRRGRDSSIPSAAAAGISVALCGSLIDVSLLSPAVQIILATLLGLGLSQSAGRTSQL